MADLGDANGDGILDYAIATPFPGTGNVPRVEVFSGAAATPLYAFFGTVGEPFGQSIDGGPDIDGDGFPDLVIGNPLAPGGGGQISVYSGSTGALLYQTAGAANLPAFLGSSLGTYFASLGDIDGDGFGDFGAAGIPNCPQVCGVYIWGGVPVIPDTCRAGNVGAGSPGGVVDVLAASSGTAGPSAGVTTNRNLIVDGTQSISIWLATPPANAGATSPWMLFGRFSSAVITPGTALPVGIGSMCFTPDPLDPTNDPALFTLADTFGGGINAYPAIPAVTPAWTLPVLTVPPPGITATLTLQGLVLDLGAATGLSITNALRLAIH